LLQILFPPPLKFKGDGGEPSEGLHAKITSLGKKVCFGLLLPLEAGIGIRGRALLLRIQEGFLTDLSSSTLMIMPRFILYMVLIPAIFLEYLGN
jgi:hypothetical protein